MRNRAPFIFMAVTILCFGMTACSVSMSGSASLNSGGDGVVINGQQPIQVSAVQPALPPTPTPPTPPPPTRVRVVGKKIEITEKVMFDIDKATIKPESNGLLTDVGKVIEQHKTIQKIRIEGHTDGEGSAKYNKKLSQGRADAVKAFLVAAGIEESRLEAVGYGEDKPIAPNDTAEGKDQNRRVEFNIIAGDAVENVEIKDEAPATPRRR